jgi:Zn-finger nucleic acid-binding protein
VCKTALAAKGRTFGCASCHGAWVAADVLVPMLEQSASSLVELPWRANTEDHVRACPQCSKDMETVALGSVALDRCEPHGVWFDAKELGDVLGQAKKFRAEPHAHESLIGRLVKLVRG